MRGPFIPLHGGLFAAALLAAGCVELTREQLATLDLPPPLIPIGASTGTVTASRSVSDPMVLSSLFELFEQTWKISPDLVSAAGTPFGELLNVGSPAAFQLRSRYLYPGIPLAEALGLKTDPALRDRLVQLSRWEKSAEVRSTGLIAVARLKDDRDEHTLHEALANLDPAVRFGAMEALLEWGHPEKAMKLLKLASENDAHPVLRVYAAGGMARLEGAEGLSKLRQFLNSPDWTVRAMAARYLGDYGTAEDYDRLLSRLDGETSSDFTAAEFAIAALKLFGKKPG